MATSAAVFRPRLSYQYMVLPSVVKPAGDVVSESSMSVELKGSAAITLSSTLKTSMPPVWLGRSATRTSRLSSAMKPA